MDIKSQLARLGLFDAKVPRYTSYPQRRISMRRSMVLNLAQWIKARLSQGARYLSLCACSILPQAVLVLRLPHPGHLSH